jgi:branched-chain amino acid transport system substrate-binding protein
MNGKKSRLLLRYLVLILILSGTLLVFSNSRPSTVLAASSTNPTAALTKYDTYKIGLQEPLSGGMASIGQDERVAFNMAIDEINAQGGVDGIKFEPVIEDHQASADGAINAFNKMVNVDKVPIMEVGFSGPIMALAPMAEKNKVIIINAGANSPALVGLSSYLFQILTSGGDEYSLMFSFIKNELHLNKVGVVWRNDDTGKTSIAYIKQIAGKAGITLVGDEPDDPNGSDFKAEVAKAKSWNADLIYLVSGGEMSTFLQQARAGGLHVPFACYSSQMGHSDIQKATADTRLVVYYTSADISPDKYPVIKAFGEKYAKVVGGQPAAGQINTYDFPYLVADLIRLSKQKGGEYYTGARLRDALLQQLTFTMHAGMQIKFRPNGGVTQPMVIFKTTGDAHGNFVSSQVKSYNVDQLKDLPRP